MIKFGESGHPVFRGTSPLSRGALISRGGGTLSIHFCADGETIETVFRTIISVNQLSIYGAVSDSCEEHKSCHVTTGRLVWVGQPDPLFVPTDVMKTPTPSTDDPVQEDKFCTNAGFLTMVDVGQYFMTKDTEEFLQSTESQWLVVSTPCQEMTNHLT